MSLLQRIKEERQSARLLQNSIRLQVLTVLLGECERVGKEIPDDEVIKVVKKVVKGTEELFQSVHSFEQKASIKVELDIMKEFVPQQLTEEQIIGNIVLCRAAGKTSVKDIMAHFKENFAGLYDGKLVSTLVLRV